MEGRDKEFFDKMMMTTDFCHKESMENSDSRIITVIVGDNAHHISIKSTAAKEEINKAINKLRDNYKN